MKGHDKELPLLALASEELGELTEAEQKLIEAVASGSVADYGTDEDIGTNPANRTDWPSPRRVDVRCIVWLCSDRRASAMVTPKGIAVAAACINGELDLSYITVPFPLYFAWCAFPDVIKLYDAEILGLYLLGSHVNGLLADRLRTRGDIALCSEFSCRGEVSLLDATVGGSLNCDGGTISNPNGIALLAERIGVDGNLTLRNGFVAEGEVRLLGATVRGDLSCVGGAVLNPQKPSLSLDGMNIGGNLFLSDGFTCRGTISLAGSAVTRSFVWRCLKEPEEAQWHLQSATVGTLVDDRASWPQKGRLFLDGFVYQNIGSEALLDVGSRIEWLQLQSRKRFLAQPYEQLASVLRRTGYAEEATSVLIAKNRERARLTRPLAADWWWYRVFGRIVEYGYRPWRAFVGSVVIILLGTMLFGAGYRSNLMAPAKESAYARNGDSAGRQLAENYQPFSPFIYSLETFVPLIKLGQADYWQPNANAGSRKTIGQVFLPKSGELLRWYLWFHIVLGWLLTTFWVGGLTGLVKT